MYISATQAFVILALSFACVLGFDLVAVGIARLVLMRPRFQVWRSSLRRWRWLAILLALVPIAQLAVTSQSFKRFLYDDLDWRNSEPVWLMRYENSLAVQIGFYALLFLAAPVAAVWLSIQPAEDEQWSFRDTWLAACALSAILFGIISLPLLRSL